MIGNEHTLKMAIAHIKSCESKIKTLAAEKEASEQLLRDLLQHDKEGAKTYTVDNYKIVVTTGFNHTLNKVKYLEMLTAPEQIDSRFQLVEEVIDLKLNKKALQDLDLHGSQQDKYLKSLFITTTDKKLHIAIKEIQIEDSYVDTTFNATRVHALVK